MFVRKTGVRYLYEEPAEETAKYEKPSLEETQDANYVEEILADDDEEEYEDDDEFEDEDEDDDEDDDEEFDEDDDEYDEEEEEAPPPPPAKPAPASRAPRAVKK